MHASKPSDKALFRSIGFVNRIKAIYHRSRCYTLILISNLRNMITSAIQHKYCPSQFHNSSKSLYSSGICQLYISYAHADWRWRWLKIKEVSEACFTGLRRLSNLQQRGAEGGKARWPGEQAGGMASQLELSTSLHHQKMCTQAYSGIPCIAIVDCSALI